jgi:hypothetical protein
MWLFVASHFILGSLCCAIGVFFSLKLRTSLWSIGASLATVVSIFGILPTFAILIMEFDRSGGPNSSESMAGFLGPMFLLAPEHLCARYVCDRFYHHDETILGSCIAASLIYATAALILTNVIVRNFDAIVGRVIERPRLLATNATGDEGDDAAVESDA